MTVKNNDDLKEIKELLIQDEEFIKDIASKILEYYHPEILQNNVYKNDENALDYSEYIVKSNVKEILEELNRSTSWLQRLTLIPASTLRSIINNNNEVSLKNAYRISKAMNISIEELFTFKEKKDK